MKGFKNAGVLKMLRWQRNARGKETKDCTWDEDIKFRKCWEYSVGSIQNRFSEEIEFLQQQDRRLMEKAGVVFKFFLLQDWGHVNPSCTDSQALVMFCFSTGEKPSW